jgi:hypothetical protein
MPAKVEDRAVQAAASAAVEATSSRLQALRGRTDNPRMEIAANRFMPQSLGSKPERLLRGNRKSDWKLFGLAQLHFQGLLKLELDCAFTTTSLRCSGIPHWFA